MKALVVLPLFFLSVLISNAQGIYAPAVGQLGTTAVHKDSSIIQAWATSCSVTRGYQQINNSQLGYASVGTNASALGVSDGQTVSLGDSGVAIVQFEFPITNGSGNDFVVFENAFNSTFLELAFVEVSSDGINYFRFNNYSSTPDTSQMGNFGVLDATHIHNLAGKYEVMYGTPFNLDDVADDILLHKNAITHVKLIDVIGSLLEGYVAYDSDNNKVNDPWPTPYPSSGFDLDAVGVINQNTAASIKELNVMFNVYPNPVNNELNIQTNEEKVEVVLLDLAGNIVLQSNGNKLDVSGLNKGVYLIQLKTAKGIGVQRIIKN